VTEPIPDPPAPDASPAPPGEARPDWLVGAEDGVTAEFERKDTAGPHGPALKLSRPIAEPEAPGARRPTFERSSLATPGEEATLDPRSPEAGEALRLLAARGAGANSPPAPEKKKAWTAAASSVPSLKLVKSAPATPAPSTEVLAQSAEEDEALAFPDAVPAGTPALTVVPGTPGTPRPGPPRVAPPHEAWWVVALDELRSNRQIQILAVCAVALVVALLVFWPRGEMGTQVREILRDSSQFDGRQVKVAGRVGDVFAVGDGYAFYLLQGRDTLVVFTRSRVPHEREHVAVKGQISTGFLDGSPHQSLFEDK